MPWNSPSIHTDEAENVTKFVFTNDTAVAETVLYRYPTYRERTVICCSTQSGCPVGCRFCGAGDNFVRNLTSDEIVSQVSHAIEYTNTAPEQMARLQIMFMSMGEPMLNQKALLPAMRELHILYPNAALLVSSSAPSVSYAEFFELAKEIPTIGLQFSVHESTDDARNLLIPFKAKLDLKGIASVGEQFYAETGRKPFFNYCAHDTNSKMCDAVKLQSLFKPHIFNATVSVICERNDGLPATNDHQRELATDFASKLVGCGYDVRVFDPAGQDTIGGGCGQLWFVQQWMKEHDELARPSCGNGLKQVHVPA